MFRSTVPAFLSAIAIMGAAPAGAITIDNISGTWTRAALTNSATADGVDTNEIRWGRATSGNGRSGFRFDGAPAGDVSVGTAFKVGTFNHLNFPIKSPTLTDADLRINVDLEGGARFSSTYTFRLDETPNGGLFCRYTGLNGVGINRRGCADKVDFVNNDATNGTFTLDGRNYQFKLSGFQTDGNIADRFLTAEKTRNMAHLKGEIHEMEQPTAVPLPASSLLLLGGIGAVAVAARKRKA